MVSLFDKIEFAYLCLLYCRNPVEVMLNTIKKGKGVKIKFRLKNGEVFLDRLRGYWLLKLINYGWSIALNDGKILKLCKTLPTHGQRVCIKVRKEEGADLGHLIEIFEHRSYGDNFSGTVIDVGASNGDSAIYFALNGASRVIALEPYIPSYRLALENISMNALSHKIILLNVALSARSGTKELVVFNEHSDMNTTDYERSYAKKINLNNFSKIEVRAITLRDLIDEFKIETIDFLKMDCEGCEHEIFEEIDPSILSTVKRLTIEYHSGLGVIPSILRRNNFEFKIIGGSTLGYIYAFRKE